MVYFNHSYGVENKSLKIDYLFYFATILLAATVFSYLIFDFKVQLQNKKIQQIEIASLSLSNRNSQADNKKVIDYKKKIDDFASVIDSRKITSNTFSFIEKNTLKNVWFSDFSMQQNTNGLILSGQSKDAKTLSNQIGIFESNKDYVLDISVLNTNIDEEGKINFVLNIILNPSVFNYQEASLNNTVNIQGSNRPVA